MISHTDERIIHFIKMNANCTYSSFCLLHLLWFKLAKECRASMRALRYRECPLVLSLSLSGLSAVDASVEKQGAETKMRSVETSEDGWWDLWWRILIFCSSSSSLLSSRTSSGIPSSSTSSKMTPGRSHWKAILPRLKSWTGEGQPSRWRSRLARTLWLNAINASWFSFPEVRLWRCSPSWKRITEFIRSTLAEVAGIEHIFFATCVRGEATPYICQKRATEPWCSSAALLNISSPKTGPVCSCLLRIVAYSLHDCLIDEYRPNKIGTHPFALTGCA